jgi:ABC-type molybdenum transport system ATPase subunit/photorepair protein PhrA
MSEIVINRVTARICEKVFLGEIDLTMAAGEHWAVMGANG